MKNVLILVLLLAVLLLAPSLTQAQKPAANPADYPIAIHVQSSHLIYVCGTDCSFNKELNVVIEGKKYELSETGVSQELLRVGDYKARIVKDTTTRSFEYERIYEFLFADGKTCKFRVVGESE